MKYNNKSFTYSPSDLSNHISCVHLTELNKKAARGELKKPIPYNRVVSMLAEKGIAFEESFLQELTESGRSIVQINQEDANSYENTIAAMRNGVDVIYQARLKDGKNWGGWADFLLKRTDLSSDLGDYSYEVVDTKLATETRAGTILQIALYSEAVGKIQGILPEFMRVQTPKHLFEYRVDEYISYVRLVKRKLEKALEAESETYPEPVSHCDICNWWSECNKRRRSDDHLSFIAGIGNSQMKEVRQHGVNTLEAMAVLAMPIPFKPSKGSVATITKLSEQARVQFESRADNFRPIYETLQIEDDKGLNRLPEPTDEDIYLDLEGDRMVDPDGLEYLIGYYYKDNYTSLWAKDEETEKKAFETFMDFAWGIKQSNPESHIYHYAPYEVTAFKRLMSKYATKEDEMDYFLRSGTFVDLFGVVRQGIRASVERYSIKDLEQFFGYERKMELRQLSVHKAELEFLLQTGRIDSVPETTKSAVQLYNQDDCVSTHKLHLWLEEIRTDLLAKGHLLIRPEQASGDPSEKITEHQKRIKPIFDALMKNVPVNADERTTAQQGMHLLGHMLDWYRREMKSFFWELYHLRELPEDELLDERKALTYLQFTGEVEPINRSSIYTYTFPVQECDFRVDQSVKNESGQSAGSVHFIDQRNGIIKLKKGKPKGDYQHPATIINLENVDSGIKEESIIDLALWVVENGIENDSIEYRAARQLLMNTSPDKDGILGMNNVDRTFNLCIKLENGFLPIQGPPGTGKSHTAAHVILKLIKQGKKIGVTALSHKVISNLLSKVWEFATEEGEVINMAQKTSSEEDHPWFITNKNEEILAEIGKSNLVAGTSFMWARKDFSKVVDYLFVDEAGQLSLIDTLAVARAADNLVLLGDPQQLKQPQQGVHPPGTEVSALEHILADHKTITNDKGVFLSETYRMHPEICQFDSQMFYESKLSPIDGLEKQSLTGNTKYCGSGLYLESIPHVGNSSSSEEEAEKIVEIVKDLIKGDVFWIDKKETKVKLTSGHIKIITPYNAQVQLILDKLPGVSVGTVDKFQGQEAPVIIYSTASSSKDDAPRGMDFLYSPNRFNVAVSRARARFIMVANERIFEPECQSPYQIKLANPFCRFKEVFDAN